MRAEKRRRAAAGGDGEAERRQVARDRNDGRLVAVVHADEDAPLFRQLLSRAHHRLAEGGAEVVSATHDLAGRLHFWPEDGVDAREAHEGEHRALDEHARRFEIVHDAELGQRTARCDARRDARDRHARRLRDVRHGPRRARVHLEDVDHVVLDGVLNVHETDDLQRARNAARVFANRPEMPLRNHERRDDTGAVARVNARLLDVLHDAADDHRARRIRHGVDIEFKGVLEEAIDQHRPVVRHIHRARHIAVERA